MGVNLFTPTVALYKQRFEKKTILRKKKRRIVCVFAARTALLSAAGMALLLVLFVGRRPFLAAGGFAVSFFGRRGRLCTQRLILFHQVEVNLLLQ